MSRDGGGGKYNLLQNIGLFLMSLTRVDVTEAIKLSVVLGSCHSEEKEHVQMSLGLPLVNIKIEIEIEIER